MQLRNIILLILLFSNFFSFKALAWKKKGDSLKYPKLVQELTMPSGFDNEYVKKLKKKEPVKFIKLSLRIIKFGIPESFYKAIDNHEFSMKETLKSKIFETGRYNLLGTDEDLNSVFEEQKKIGDDNFNDNSASEVGYLKIAEYILTGKITHSYPIVKQIGGYFSLKVTVGASITITNITTGEIVYTKNIDAENEEKLFVTAEGMIIQGPRNLTNKALNSLGATGKDIDLSPQYYSALQQAIYQIVYFIEEKYPIMGEVIAVSGNKIISTISQANGIKKNDFLFIVRTGEALNDSSGNFLGFSKTMIGVAQIKNVEKNMSTAKIIKLENKSELPKKHDIVISLPANTK